MKHHLVTALLILLLFASACNGTPAIPSTDTAQATLAATSTPTVPPTDTPIPGRAILLGSADAELIAQVEVLLASQAAGLATETVPSLDASALTPEVRLVIALETPPNLSELMAAAPQAQFVVVDRGALEPTGQLTVIRLAAAQQAFVAGLAATLISDDWRSAGLIPASAPELQDAFVNGGGYFCGDCRPGWPLAVYYPLVGGPADSNDVVSWMTLATDLFDTSKVEVFYLSAEADKPEVRAYLDERTQPTVGVPVSIVGELPPSPELANQWATTVSFDVPGALEQALPSVLGGASAGSIIAPVRLSHVNDGLFSPGRQQILQNVLGMLESGQLTPNSLPEVAE